MERLPTGTDDGKDGLTQVESLPVTTATSGGPSSTRDGPISREGLGHGAQEEEQPLSVSPNQTFRVYKRRWFGLFQLVLLNIIISWDWLTFSAVSKTSAEFYGVSETAINWLSTGFLFAFVVVSPIVILVLHKGPKPSIIASSALILVGNWIRYAGTRASPPRYGVVLFGQILTGLAQPFVLAAPTRYSDLWFTERGRISATAVASLANPFGGAIGQLVGPFLATETSKVPDLVLYVAIISSVATIPSLFIPAGPPTPASASSAVPKTPLAQTFHALLRNRSFYLVFIPFSIYVGFFNALSSLLNQVLYPYDFTEEQAGIAGALLIVVGLVCSAVLSPTITFTSTSLLSLKVLTPVISICYAVFIVAPPTRDVAAPYAILSLLGASSFALMPVALEYITSVTWPASPEVASTIAWTGGQLLGGIFIVVMNALKDGDGDGREKSKRPSGNMHRALIFEAVIACVVIPLPLFLGVKRLGTGSGKNPERERLDVEDRRRRRESVQ